jgi:hypothetical protein
MDSLKDILIFTMIGFLSITVLIAFTIYWNNRKLELNREANVLKLKIGRTLRYLYPLLFYFFIFIHFGIFLIKSIFAGDKHGLALEFRFSSVFGITMSFIFLTILFLISVPNLIVLLQSLKNELGRAVKLNKEEKTLEIQTEADNINISNKDIENIEFHIKKIIVRGDQEFNFIRINLKNNSSILITDLLTDVNGFTDLQSIYKNVKKIETRKYFNIINCGQ